MRDRRRQRPRTADHVVEFIASHPGLAECLLSEHADGGHGYCRAHDLGHHSWPCAIYTTAGEALRLTLTDRLTFDR